MYSHYFLLNIWVNGKERPFLTYCLKGFLCLFAKKVKTIPIQPWHEPKIVYRAENPLSPPHWNTWTLLHFHDRDTVRVRDLTFDTLSELQAAWSALSVDVTVSVAEQQGSFGRVSLPKEEEGVACVPVRCYLVPLLFQLSKIVFFPRTLNTGFTTEWTGEGIKGTSL